MKLQFEITKEDYISFNMFHLENSKTFRNALFIQRYILPIIFLALPFILSGVTVVPLIFWLIPSLIAFMLWVLFYKRYFKRSVKKRLEKLLDEGKNKSPFGPVSLSLDETGILEVTNSGESKANWSSVEKVEQTQDYIFIYINSVNAAIIPKRAFSHGGQMDEFLRIVQGHLKS